MNICMLFKSNLVNFLNNRNIFRNIFIEIKHVDSVKYQILKELKYINISNYLEQVISQGQI